MDEPTILPPLMDHQFKTVEFGLRNPYFIMGLKPGLGKTVCAATIIERLKQKFERPVNTLYVCPASYKISTKTEILKWYPHLTITCYMDKTKIREPWAEDIVIINYEMLDKAEILFKWADVVIIDEAHYLKNMDSKRSERLHRLVYEYEIRRLLILTGTPISNQVADFYSLIALCYYNPRIQEPAFLKKYMNYIDFAEKFSYKKVKKTYWGDKIVYEGIRNVPELKNWIKNIYISFDPDKVLKIPKGIVKDVQIAEMDFPELLEDFKKFSESDNGESVKSKAKKQAALAMAPFTIEYVKNLLEQGVDKIVIFSDHVDTAELIAKEFEVEPVTGNTPIESRPVMVNKFQNNKDVKVIVGTTQVLGVSFTLTASCNLVINDYPWRPSDLEQLMNRIRRVCQKRTPIYHFMHGSFQSAYILRTLERKMKVIKEALE